MIVGPVKLNMRNDVVDLGSIPLPRLLEAGGVALIKKSEWKSLAESSTVGASDRRRLRSERKEYRTRRADL